MQKTRKKKEWITPDTWQAIEERRRLKKKINDSKSARLRVKYRAAYAEITGLSRERSELAKRHIWKGWQRKQRKRHKRESTGMSIKSLN